MGRVFFFGLGTLQPCSRADFERDNKHREKGKIISLRSSCRGSFTYFGVCDPFDLYSVALEDQYVCERV